MTDISSKDMSIQKDIDLEETSEWLEALEGVIRVRGADRARFLLDRMIQKSLPERYTASIYREYTVYKYDSTRKTIALSG